MEHSDLEDTSDWTELDKLNGGKKGQMLGGGGPVPPHSASSDSAPSPNPSDPENDKYDGSYYPKDPHNIVYADSNNDATSA